MSDDNTSKRDFTLRNDEFKTFLDKVSGDSICPACGNENWLIIGSSGPDGITSQVRLQIQEKDGYVIIPASAIYCVKCGFIRMHATGLVLDGLKDVDGESPTNE